MSRNKGLCCLYGGSCSNPYSTNKMYIGLHILCTHAVMCFCVRSVCVPLWMFVCLWVCLCLYVDVCVCAIISCLVTLNDPKQYSAEEEHEIRKLNSTLFFNSKQCGQQQHNMTKTLSPVEIPM